MYSAVAWHPQLNGGGGVIRKCEHSWFSFINQPNEQIQPQRATKQWGDGFRMRTEHLVCYFQGQPKQPLLLWVLSPGATTATIGTFESHLQGQPQQDS